MTSPFKNIVCVNASQHCADQLLTKYEEGCWRLLKEDDRKLMATYPGYYIKIFKNNSVNEKVKNLLVGNRAQRFLRGNQLLSDIGLGTAGIVLHGICGNNPFIILEAVCGWDFGDVIHSFFYKPDRKSLLWKRELLKEVGRLLGTMHRQNIVHGDLRASNILLNIDSGKLKIVFIDNERTRVVKNRNREKIRNLVQILMLSKRGFGTTDTFRLLNSYLKHSGDKMQFHKNIKHKVLAVLKKRIERKKVPLGGKILDELRSDLLLSCPIN